MTNARRTDEIYKALTAVHPSHARTSAAAEDEYSDVDPECNEAIMSFSLDTPPGPGYCAVPFHPSPLHSANGRDVRWEPSFKSFIFVRSSKDRAGGVYTDENDMRFAIQGLHPQPEFEPMTSFLDCLELWKADCRSGVHGQVGPPTPKAPESPLKTIQSRSSSALPFTPPNSPCTLPSIFRSPRRTAGPSPGMAPMAYGGARSSDIISPAPVTPSRVRGPSSPLNPAVAGLRARPAVLPGTPAAVVMPPRTSRNQNGLDVVQRGPPPPYPSSLRGPSSVPSVPSVFTLPSSAATTSVSPSAATSLTPPTATAVMQPSSASTPTSAPAFSRLGPAGPHPPSTFIQPVWLSQDSQGLGLILTRNCAYARDLHATHGNIDVVTDSDKLNRMRRMWSNDHYCLSAPTIPRVLAKDVNGGQQIPRFQGTPCIRARLRAKIHAVRCNVQIQGVEKSYNLTFVYSSATAWSHHQRCFPACTHPLTRSYQATRKEVIDGGLFQAHSYLHARPLFVNSPPQSLYFTISAMGKRAKAKDDPTRRAPGPTHWVVGVKRAFLKRHQAEFEASKNRGQFYDRITTKFMMKFGPGFDLSTDLEEDLPDPDADDMTEDYSDLTPDEVKAAKEYRKRLRSKIGSYYRGEVNKIKPTDTQEHINELFTDHTQAQVPRRSVPTHIVQYYSKLYYSARVKSVFEAVFVKEREKADADLARWDEMGVDPPEGWKHPVALSVRNRVTAECWERETESFKDSVVRAHQEEVERQKAAFETAMRTPKVLTTPEDFQHAISTAGLYLQPLMDAVNTNASLCASIFLFGPMPDDGGKLGVLSAHAGVTRGLNSQILPYFDPDGLSDIETILIDFAKNCYSDPECLRRSLSDARSRRAISGMTPRESILPVSTPASPSARESSPPRQPLARLRRAGETAPTTASDSAHSPAPAHQHQLIPEASPTKTSADPSSLFDDDDVEMVDVYPATDTSRPDVSMDADFDATPAAAPMRTGGTPDVEVDGLLDAEMVVETGASVEVMPDATNGAKADAMPDATIGAKADATPDATNGAKADATLNFNEETDAEAGTMPDATIGAMPDATPDAMPGATIGATPDAMPDATAASPALDATHDMADALSKDPSATPAGVSPSDLADIAKGREEDVWKCKMPVGCPPHIAGIFLACSRGQEWGFEFARAVTAYLALERSLAFPILNHGRLVLAGSIRPSIYRDWVVGKRDFGHVVDIGDPQVFGTKWWTWWEAMQPPLRVSPAGDLLAVDVVAAEATHLAQWGHLEKCCGRDGLVQFLLTLVWWGDVVNDPDQRVAHVARRLEWELAVQDFREVLEALMSAPDFKRIAAKRAAGIDYTINMSSKHGLNDNDKNKPPSKRARTALLDRAVGPAPAKARPRTQVSNENKAPQPQLPSATVAAATRQSSRKRYVSVSVLRTRE
ncbi:uncharacterized protein SCHCODRAFT_02672012 [Schizophyllum commune H4-8]|nr:uncharacterized protein SCHCODRAFT_02672012 [Schizophyllum commune H4-8]KAI5886761.1 hypothetical protein SCHCODRAFT_02672012 [Schizophyllum commune H4-8]